MSCTGSQEGSRVWRTLEAVHVDVRDLDPPEPMVAILRLIDQDEVDTVLIAHLIASPSFSIPSSTIEAGAMKLWRLRAARRTARTAYAFASRG
ncbi:MAG: hypothetical protein HC869_03960 [Rhodospirillales bacterium]|nr:hypothetical protein [Rhodospirillales bacterium]